MQRGRCQYHAATGFAIREFPLNTGFGFADYLLYVNGKACGVIEAKKEGATHGVLTLSVGRASRFPRALLPQVKVQSEMESHYPDKDFWTRAIGFTTNTAV